MCQVEIFANLEYVCVSWKIFRLGRLFSTSVGGVRGLFEIKCLTTSPLSFTPRGYETRRSLPVSDEQRPRAIGTLNEIWNLIDTLDYTKSYYSYCMFYVYTYKKKNGSFQIIFKWMIATVRYKILPIWRFFLIFHLLLNLYWNAIIVFNKENTFQTVIRDVYAPRSQLFQNFYFI